MSDQNGGQKDKNEAGPKPDAPLSGRTREAPLIDGAAVETPSPKAKEEAVQAPETEAAKPEPREWSKISPEAAPAESQEPAEPAEKQKPAGPQESAREAKKAEAAPATEKPRKKSSLLPVAAVIGVAAVGGGYYAWTQFYEPSEAPTKIAAAPRASLETTPENSAPAPAVAPAQIEPPKPEPPKADLEKPAPLPPPPAEPMKKAEAPAEHAPEAKSEIAEVKRAEAPQAQPEKPAPVAATPVEAPKKAEAPAEPAPAAAAAKSEAAEAKPNEARPAQVKPMEPPLENVKPPVAATGADKALAQVTAQLAATQAELERVTQRLQTVEGQLAAPKNDMRAELASREAGLSRAGDASARIVITQSLLTALRQGDDYAAQLTALQGYDSDSGRIARLRAGLAAPSNGKLAADFAALAPKLAEAAAPAPKSPEARPPKNFGESVLTFLESHAQKIVRIRPANAPDGDATSARLDAIEQKLLHGDLAGALAERALLPATALALSADWAKAAQTRLDAETAAKAELAEALQALNKTKS